MDDKEDATEQKLQTVLMALTIVVILTASYFAFTILSENGNNDYDHITQPGDLAKSYLQNSTYTEILIEVDFIDGYAPSDGTIETLIVKLKEVCDKNSIEYELSDAIGGTDRQNVYNINDVFDLEKKYRDHKTKGGAVVMYIIYLNGFYEESDQTLGVSYQGSSFAIFKEKVDDINIPFGVRQYVSPSDFEKSVVVHESGHLLGLVNINYESIQTHEDSNSEHHCAFEDCVMFHALEHSRQSYMQKIFEGGFDELKPPVDFGQNCLDDLENLKKDIY